MTRCTVLRLALPLCIVPVSAQTSPAPKVPAGQNFFVHAFHKDKLGGTLECSLCHVAVKDGSVELKRPGHDQCMTCHSDDFDKKSLRQTVCAQCHTASPPTSAADLVPFPRYKGSRAILFEFSHARHVDPKARIDGKTGFRADCTFCHKFNAEGTFGTFPGHQQCATCHSKPGMKPQLTAELTAESCKGCHTPEEIENPGFTETRRFANERQIASGKYINISFSHVAHFKVKDQFDLHCTTCHYAIPASTSIGNLSLPKNIDFFNCHESERAIKTEFRMSNCKTCHAASVTALPTPSSHTVNVKPDFHTEAFRTRHESEAAAPNAKCFVCHQNVVPSVESRSVQTKIQCVECHEVMRPANHTSRWKDDLHGKYVALDRNTCATCHTAAYCSDCHNELPRSHQPLPLFKAGAHAFPARLDLRNCFTCHTFQNTCRECHVNQIALNLPSKNQEAVVASNEVEARRKTDLLQLFR